MEPTTIALTVDDFNAIRSFLWEIEHPNVEWSPDVNVMALRVIERNKKIVVEIGKILDFYSASNERA